MEASRGVSKRRSRCQVPRPPAAPVPHRGRRSSTPPATQRPGARSALCGPVSPPASDRPRCMTPALRGLWDRASPCRERPAEGPSRALTIRQRRCPVCPRPMTLALDPEGLMRPHFSRNPTSGVGINKWIPDVAANSVNSRSICPPKRGLLSCPSGSKRVVQRAMKRRRYPARNALRVSAAGRGRG